MIDGQLACLSTNSSIYGTLCQNSRTHYFSRLRADIVWDCDRGDWICFGLNTNQRMSFVAFAKVTCEIKYTRQFIRYAAFRYIERAVH